MKTREISPVEARQMVLDYQLQTLRGVIEKHPGFAKKMIDEGLEKYFKPVKNMTEKEVSNIIGILISDV